MSFLEKKIEPLAKDINILEDSFKVFLTDGREVTVPLSWFPKLLNATKDELENWRLIGNGVGIHWESLDEDISIRGILS